MSRRDTSASSQASIGSLASHIGAPRAKLKKSRTRGGKDKDRRTSQTVTRSFNGNEYTGLLNTNSLGQRSLEGPSASYTWASGVRYEGPFVASRAEGQGKFFWPDCSTYTGEVVNGKRHGQGVYVAPDGVTMYNGQWRDGKRHGQGRLTYDAEGESYYDGDWEDGQKHGVGCQVWPSKNSYDGQWKHGKMSGHGTMMWVDGGSVEKYVGYWEDNRPQGTGTQTWLANETSAVMTSRPGAGALPAQQMQNQYEGEWSDGVRHGKGVFSYANGAKYFGDWVGNAKHGVGRYTHEDGRIYDGPFSEDRMGEVGVPASQQPAKGVLNIGAEDNPVRRCMDVSDLEPFCLPVDVGGVDLTVGSFYDEPEEVFREVFNLLLRHLGLLKRIYHDYRVVMQKPGDDPFMLKARQLWALACDMGLVSPGCSLSRLNRAVFNGPRHQKEVSPDDAEILRPLEPGFEGEPRTPREPTPPPPDEGDEGQEALPTGEGYDGEGEDEYSEYEEESQVTRNSSRGSSSFGNNSATRGTISRSSSFGNRSSVTASQKDSVGRASASPEQDSSPKLAPPAVAGLGSIAEETGSAVSALSAVNTIAPPNTDGAAPDGADAEKPEGEGGEGSPEAEDRPAPGPFSKFWRREGQGDLADIHAPATAVFFRHFLEALVRLSVVNFPQEKGLERQIRRMFDEKVLLLPNGSAGCSRPARALAFLADEELQGVLRDFEPQLQRVFRENAAGEGAYAAPQWTPADAEAAASTPSRRRKRHFGGQNRRAHVSARLDTTVRIKDVLQLLRRSGLLAPISADSAPGAADGGAPAQWHGPVFQSGGDEALDGDVQPGDSASGAPTPVPTEPSVHTQQQQPQRSGAASPGRLSRVSGAHANGSRPSDAQQRPSAASTSVILQRPSDTVAFEARATRASDTVASEVPCEAEEPAEPVGRPEDVLSCDFTFLPLEVLRILCELQPPEAAAKVYWALERGEEMKGDEVPLLEFLETELTFAEFSRLLLRLTELRTAEAQFEAHLPLGARLEGFLAHVFLPSLSEPYVPPAPPEPDEPQEDPEEASPPAALQVAGAGLADVDGVYARQLPKDSRPGTADRRPDGGYTMYVQEAEQFCIVFYPAAGKEGPLWSIQRVDSGKRAYVARLGEGPEDVETAQAPTSGWEVFDAPKDKASLPGKAPVPSIEPKVEQAEGQSGKGAEFWGGFDDDDAAAEAALDSAPRVWPEGYESEVADW